MRSAMLLCVNAFPTASAGVSCSFVELYKMKRYRVSSEEEICKTVLRISRWKMNIVYQPCCKYANVENCILYMAAAAGRKGDCTGTCGSWSCESHTVCLCGRESFVSLLCFTDLLISFFLIFLFVVVFDCLSFWRRFHPARNSCWTRPVASNASIRSIVIIVKLGKRRWARRRGARQCPIYHRNRWDQHRLLSHLQCRSQLHLHRRLHRHSEELMSARDCSKSQLSSRGKNLHDCFVIDLICCVFSVIWTRTWLANVTCTSFWTEIF